jgi:TPP-dependent 2-oxoacid decarboxylase
MTERPTVADYIVRRLARKGITDCFGVAGDFAFKLCDAVAPSEAIRWIGCSNELDAAYASDGYARVRGCSMLMTTYAVGELSALNGVMGARAERSCVFHLVGMPTMRNLPAAVGCRGWFTAKVATLGELDAALARAATSESASYIEVVGGRMDLPAGLAMAHRRLDALYGNG